MPNVKEHFVGIDAAKDWLDVAVVGERGMMQFANTRRGIAEFVGRISLLEPKLMVVEATGGYEEALVLALFGAGLPLALVSPQRVRQYAKAKGLLAKTDQLDARNLAEYGKNIRPRLFVAKSEGHKTLSALVGRRKQLEEMLQAERNRLRTASCQMRASLERSIAFLEREMQQMEKEIRTFIQEHADFQVQEKLLRSAKSIGS